MCESLLTDTSTNQHTDAEFINIMNHTGGAIYAWGNHGPKYTKNKYNQEHPETQDTSPIPLLSQWSDIVFSSGSVLPKTKPEIFDTCSKHLVSALSLLL